MTAMWACGRFGVGKFVRDTCQRMHVVVVWPRFSRMPKIRYAVSNCELKLADGMSQMSIRHNELWYGKVLRQEYANVTDGLLHSLHQQQPHCLFGFSGALFRHISDFTLLELVACSGLTTE